jgi:membrane fusion protein (multidrug efflux system)
MPPAEVDALRAARAVAEAEIAQARAALVNAELDLSYTRIVAPVAGRIGRAIYGVGNLVGPQSGPLAIIVSGDPVHVRFPVTQRERLRVRREMASGGEDIAGLAVLARLADGTLYKHEGRLDLIDVVTDAGTDSLTVRAVFPNPEGTLMDGQHVGVIIRDKTPLLAVTVPHSALLINHQGIFVLTVDQAGIAEVRHVRLGVDLGSRVVVRSGLGEGDRVIVQGNQRVRPGQPVVLAAEPASAQKTPSDRELPQ